jgi:hypothetical protein
MLAFEDRDLVIRMLRDPQGLRGWTPRQFDLLLRQAHAADMLGRLAVLVEAHGLAPHLPAGLREHLGGTRRALRSHEAQVRRELNYIRTALQALDLPVVLLKGAAYLAAGLPAAEGRFFADVDILVPRQRLPEVEAALLLAGWLGSHHSAYDQHYYREWMHELPPLVHIRRQSALDVHHTITPLTSRWPTDGAALLAQALPAARQPGFAVLAPPDMVLHSMVHLLMNEELSHGLRDLADIDQLLRHFGARPAFWPALTERARSLGLLRALYYGLRNAADILGTPVPQAAMAQARAAASAWTSGLWLAAWRRALRSPHPSAGDAWTAAARFALYVRGTGIRMPPLMLARHLWIKAWRRHDRPPVESGQAG